MSNVPALDNAVRGTTTNGVPFLALPPGADEARSLIVAWHGGDPPRTEEALAAAVPMLSVQAWRIYLGLPLSGQRMPADGAEEIMRRGMTDGITLLMHPIVSGAVSELPAAVNEIRSTLSIDTSLPIGLFGFSMGGETALLATARAVLPVRAVVTFGAPVDMMALADSLGKLYGSAYEWNDDRRRLALDISVAQEAPALASSGAHILLGVGADDPLPVREPSETLLSEVRARSGVVELRILEGIAHGFVDEPGHVPAPQGPQARAIDSMASDWFLQHL